MPDRLNCDQAQFHENRRMEILSPFVIASGVVAVFFIALLIIAQKQQQAHEREQQAKKAKEEERRNALIDGMF